MTQQRLNPTAVTFEHAEQHLETMVEACATRGEFFRIETEGLPPVMLVPGAYVDRLDEQIRAAL